MRRGLERIIAKVVLCMGQNVLSSELRTASRPSRLRSIADDEMVRVMSPPRETSVCVLCARRHYGNNRPRTTICTTWLRSADRRETTGGERDKLRRRVSVTCEARQTGHRESDAPPGCGQRTRASQLGVNATNLGSCINQAPR